jgi:hypothetical protein
VEFNGNVFESILTGSRKADVFEDTCFRYQRGQNPTLRTIQRKDKVAKELASSAKEIHKINTFFKLDSGTSSQETCILPSI